MRAGRLDRRIAIQRKTVTQSDSGAPVEAWTTLVTRSATASPVRGGEDFKTPEIVAKEMTEFLVRWSAAVSDVSPKDRIVYPAPTSGDSPATPIPNRSIYDILAVHEVGRREALRIVTERRADVAP